MLLNTNEQRMPVDFPPIEDLELRARKVRATCFKLAADGGEGHVSSALSCADILVALYAGWLRVSPETYQDPMRDRFLISKGHGVTALYATLAERGYFDPEEMASYAQPNSMFPNHACRLMTPWVEISTGSLGIGLGMGTGMAYSIKMRGLDRRVVVLMSDGECNEGSVWESAAFACAQKQDQLVAIVDNNNSQAVGRTSDLLGPETTLESKFREFGWSSRAVNGHDFKELTDALNDLPFEEGKPSVIVAKTIGGKGTSFSEGQMFWHYRVPSPEDLENAFRELDAQPLYGCSP
jgi:transketolase